MPALLAIIAMLFLTGRKRQEILIQVAVVVAILIIIEALFLLVGFSSQEILVPKVPLLELSTGIVVVVVDYYLRKQNYIPKGLNVYTSKLLQGTITT